MTVSAMGIWRDCQSRRCIQWVPGSAFVVDIVRAALDADDTITQPRESGQIADIIVYDNLCKLRDRAGDRYDRCVWAISYEAVWMMTDAYMLSHMEIETLPPVGYGVRKYGQSHILLMGRPVWWHPGRLLGERGDVALFEPDPMPIPGQVWLGCGSEHFTEANYRSVGPVYLLGEGCKG